MYEPTGRYRVSVNGECCQDTNDLEKARELYRDAHDENAGRTVLTLLDTQTGRALAWSYPGYPRSSHG